MIVEDDNGNIYDLHDLDVREPEPPEDDRLPLDLNEVDRHYRVALAEDLRAVPEHAAQALAAVPELLVRLRAAEEELAEWRALSYRDEYGVYHAGSEDCEPSRAYSHDAKSALFSAKTFGGTAQARRIYTGPWEELQEAPF